MLFLIGSALGPIAIWSNQQLMNLVDIIEYHERLVIKTANKIISNSQQAEELLLFYFILGDTRDRDQFFIYTAQINHQITLLNEAIQSIELKRIIQKLTGEQQKLAAQADYLILQHDQKNRENPYFLNDRFRTKIRQFNLTISRLVDTVLELKENKSRQFSVKKDRIVLLTEIIEYAVYLIIPLFLLSIILGIRMVFTFPGLSRFRNGLSGGDSKNVAGSVDKESKHPTVEATPLIKQEINHLKSTNQKLTSHNKILKQEILKSRIKEKELHKQATTDFLTNVLNRRAFFEKAQEEVERTLRYKNKLSVLILDIDHFKSINDSYGHHAGDEVLKKFIQSVENTLRNSDFIGRIGGEEFAVLLPETELDKALIIGERIRDLIGNITIPVDHLTLRLTVSLGAAEYNSGEKNIYSTIKRADAALYRAKESGRNRICTEATT